MLTLMTTNLTFESPSRGLFSQVCNGALAAFERLPRVGRRPDVTRRIARREIPKPVFITGLPRTGTTLLHGLLAQDHELFVAPLTWEAIYRSRGQGDIRRRIERTERDLKTVRSVGSSLPTDSSSFSFRCQIMLGI
jgi:hypothetical protein